jgi:hypothetical protein
VGNSKTSHVVGEEKEEEEDDDHGDDDEEAAVELKVAELGIRDAAEGEEEAAAAAAEEEEEGDDEEEAVEADESFENEGGVRFKQHVASVSSDREDLGPSP